MYHVYLYENIRGQYSLEMTHKVTTFELSQYGKCPKITNTKVSDKMIYANSADQDQTAPEGAVWSGSTLFAIPLKYFKEQLHKKRNLGQNSME